MVEKFPKTPPEKAKEEVTKKDADVEELMRMLGVPSIKREQTTKPEDQPVVEHGEEMSISEMLEPTEPEKKPEAKKEEAKLPEAEFKEIEEAKFDVGKAFETPGFSEFLNKRVTNIEKLSRDETKELYGVFETTNSFREFYKDVIKKETGLEVEDKEVQSTLESHFVNMKDVDPKYVGEMKRYLQEYKESPARIAKKEEELNRLGGKERLMAEEAKVMGKRAELGKLGMEMGRMEQKREISKTMHGIRGFFNWRNSEIIQFLVGGAEIGRRVIEKVTGVAGKAVEGKAVKRTYEEIQKAKEAKSKTVDEWRKEISNLSQTIEAETQEALKAGEKAEVLRKLGEESERLKRETENFKKFFFESGYFEPARQIIGMAKEELKERLRDLANPKAGVKKIAEGLKLVEKLEASDIEVLGKQELSKFTERFGKLLEKKTARQIKETLEKLPTEGLAWKGLESGLEKLIQKGGLGVKDLEVSREVIRKRLEEYLKRGVPPKGETKESFRVKKLAAKMLLIKWGY